ncbi:MAG TPA: hypothetical protein VFX86_04725 [Candidatus Saccharimonadales bacterium]|nr:hypothetical protein [Candidatus Saccharimonadales bacterium]
MPEGSTAQLMEIDSAYADVMVACPMPGREDEAAQPLGKFIQTEIGQRVLGDSIENVERLRATGMDTEQAVSIALGAAVVKDDAGEIVRAEAVEQPRVEEEAKKK